MAKLKLNDCKIRNSTGRQVLLGVFGLQDSAQHRVSLKDGEINRADLLGGMRVFVAWDAFTDDIIGALPFRVGDGITGSNGFDVRIGPAGELVIDAFGRASPAPF